MEFWSPSCIAGTPPTQVKQVRRPSDRRAPRPRPPRGPPELLGGSSPQKTLDPGLGPFSLSESSWVSGSSSCGEPGNQRKTIHVDFLDSQRDLGREAWALESTAMMMKKKKKKPKQKRYSQPQAGGPWDDDNAKEPKGQPFADDTQKSGVLPSQPTTVGTEYRPASRENLKKECEIDSKTAKPVAENLVSEGLGVPSCSLEKPLKTVVSSQPKLRVEAEVKGKTGPQGQDRKLMPRDECTSAEKSQTIGTFKLKGPLTEVSAHEVECPLEIRPKEGCSTVLNHKAVGAKPTAAKAMPNLIPTLTASNPLESSLKEGNDERRMTKLQNDKQKEFSEGAEEVKELKKEAFPKQSQELNIAASQQLQDKEVVQASGPGSEPFKRMAGDGKSRKGGGSSGKGRASSGKVRARAELPFLPDSQEDSRAVLGPSEPAATTGRMTAGAESEALGRDPSKQPGFTAHLPETVVMGEPSGMTDPGVTSTLQALIPLGNESDVTQTSGARPERGAVAIDLAVSNQGKEGKCPWMDREAAPWLSEKPKKRGSEGKNKKVKNSYSAQPARIESKEESRSPLFVGKDGGAGGTPHQNKELGLAFPINHEPVLSQTAATPTAEVVDRKGKTDEANSFELGTVGGNKNIVKDSTVAEAAAKVTDLSCQNQTQGAGFVPSVPPEEPKTDAAKGHSAVADKPNKRSRDGKSKKVKNSFPEKHALESKTDATKIHVPMEATGVHRIEGIGYVDENRNITFTCHKTPSGGMNQSAPPEALDSAASEKLPTCTPQVAKGRDSFPDTLAESRQETAPVQISKLLAVDNCSKDGVTDQERPKAPSPVTPSASTGGGALAFPASIETVNSPGDNCLKNKGELADPMKSEAGVDGGPGTGESKSVPSSASKHPVGKLAELAKGHLLSGVPVEDQSLPGEARGLESCAGRSNLTTHPVNEKKECAGGSAADKAQKPHFCEDQNAEGEVSRVPASLNKEMDMTLSSPKSEKDKLEVIRLTSEITELEDVSLPTPALESEFLDGGGAGIPSRVVDKLVATASKGLQLPDPKDRRSEAPENMTGKPEPKALGEWKKEDKSRMAEPVKGYMRPTKSRGLTPPLPKPATQERERAKPAKPSGMSLPCGGVCARVAFESASEAKSLCFGPIQTLIILVNH